ncbi:polysaccharide lyase family 8 super-sandwich domain-containing protein [Psychromicrobium xiongbiense]|uniref:polysaccharide lyase family 8 super-sandwich domain-containing protein n=1 Tax=Psychromicrobium xiongbiense TaxID=3051184 RepID=UPI002554B802|nr:polysaccharide lyase family 8 super-sandwich domain-containing protein [Psychromicrobium sp. YIM S02556]
MPLSPSRRSFLLGAAAAAAAFALPLPGAAAITADRFSVLVDRRRDFLTGGSVAATHPALAQKRSTIDASVTALRASFNRSAGRTNLWPNLPLDKLGSLASHTDNMGLTFNQITSLALAWASAGSIHHADSDLLIDIAGALTFMAGKYTQATKKAGNWWFWEIGAPRQVADTLTLLGDSAPTDPATQLITAVRFFAPDPNKRTGSTLQETGANRSDKALACIARGLVSRNADDVALGRDALSDVRGGGKLSLFALVSSGDGFYADGSFIQHGGLPYSGTYGGVAISGVAECMAMLAGSEWAVADPAMGNLLDAIDKTFAPFQWDARTMDTTRGRAVSRQFSRDYDSGFAIATAVLVLAESGSSAQRDHCRALVKGWLSRTTDQNVGANSQGLAASARSLAVLDDASVIPPGPRIGITNTYTQERMVQHRGDWAAVVSTSSKRIGRYEWGNLENSLGWYQGDGVFYLYHRADPTQFSADFWPTVDPYALPGITVNGELRQSGAAAGTGIPTALNSYAGGVTLGGEIGTTAMDLQNATKKLSANKSWYFLKDSVVCVGSGITDSSGTTVRTMVENRGFAPGNLPAVHCDGAPRTLNDTLQSASSVHVEGHAGFVALTPDSLAPQTLGVRSESRTGTWQAINSGGDTGGTTDPVNRDFLRIEQAHPAADGWYAYQVLPLASADQTAAAAQSPQVRVLVADRSCHIIDAAGGRLGHFFTAGTWAGYTASGPCAIGHRTTPAPVAGGGPGRTGIVRQAVAGAQLTEVVLAQPTRAGGTVTVTFPFDAPGTTLSIDPGVTVTSTSPLTLTAVMDTLRGGERRVTFASMATSEAVTVRFVDGNGTSVAPDQSLTGALGDAYTATAATPDAYRLVTTPQNASGTFGDQPVTVTFVYEAAAPAADPSPAASSGSVGSAPSGAAPAAPSTDSGDSDSLASTGIDLFGLGLGAAAATAAGATVLGVYRAQMVRTPEPAATVTDDAAAGELL